MKVYYKSHYERVIANQVRRHGGFSTYWAEENQGRAKAATEMFARGDMVQVGNGGTYPWVAARIAKEQP